MAAQEPRAAGDEGLHRFSTPDTAHRPASWLGTLAGGGSTVGAVGPSAGSRLGLRGLAAAGRGCGTTSFGTATGAGARGDGTTSFGTTAAAGVRGAGTASFGTATGAGVR